MVEIARKVLKNGFFNWLRFLIGGVGGLLITVILVRLLTPELYGIYQLAISVAFLLLTFTDAGINRTAVRYISHALGEENKNLARSYFRYLLRIKLILAFLSSLILFILAELLAIQIFNKPILVLPLKTVSVFLFFFSLMDFLNGAFEALQKFEFSAMRSIAYESLRLTFIPIFILLGYSVFGALIGLSLAAILTFIILLYFLTRKHIYLFKGESVHIDNKKVLKYLGYLSLATLISGTLLQQTDAIMLGMLMNSEDVGFYKSAFNMTAAFMGLISIATVIFPVFTQLEGNELQNAFEKSFKYLMIFSLPFGFGLAFIANPLINTIYGVEYLPAVIPFYILSLLILLTPFNFFGLLFQAKEKPEYLAKLTIITSVLNVLFNYILILKFGVAGAAIATVIVRYFNAFVLAILSKSVFDVFPNANSIYKPLFSSFIMLAFFYVIPNPETIIDGIIDVTVAVFLYILVIYCIKGLTKEDVLYISEVIGQKERLINSYGYLSSKLKVGRR